MLGSTRVRTGVIGLAIPFVVGCVSSGASPGRARYGPEDFARLRDSVTAAAAVRASEPRIRLITPTILGASRFVEASFRVNENAYVTVVAVDYDGRARVVFPDSPAESGFVRANTLYRLPTFFAGFGMGRLATYPGNRYGMLHPAFGNATGLLFAVASGRPLQLQRLADDAGDWDEIALERLLWNRSRNGAGFVLGRLVSLTGQEFDTDYSGFTQGITPTGYMFASFDPYTCDEDTRALYDVYYHSAVRNTITYIEIDGIQYARLSHVDGCTGAVSHQLVPVGPAQRGPQSPTDSTSTDSSSSTPSTARITRAPYVGAPVDAEANSLVERPMARGGAIGGMADDLAAGSSRRPRIDRGLRLLPAEPAGGGGSFRPSQGLSTQEELMRERQARRASEAQQRRTAPQREPAYERPTRSEPPRSEPAAIERTAPAPTAEGSEPFEHTGKPVKE